MKEYEKMSFLDHLEVFRWHLIRSVLAVFFFSVIAFVFKDIIFDHIILRPKDPTFPTYIILCNISRFLGIGDFFCMQESAFSLMNINMSGQFSSHIMVSIFSGFIISFPYIFWEFWCFVKPALHNNEKNITKGIVFFSSLLFILGILFGYFLITPLSINFLGSYQVSSTVSNQISLNSFISTFTTVCLANGFIFELPVLVYFLSKAGLLTPSFMKIYRKHAIILTLILSAIITPPDIVSQVLVSLPLLILYEFSIILSTWIVKK